MYKNVHDHKLVIIAKSVIIFECVLDIFLKYEMIAYWMSKALIKFINI